MTDEELLEELEKATARFAEVVGDAIDHLNNTVEEVKKEAIKTRKMAENL